MHTMAVAVFAVSLAACASEETGKVSLQLSARRAEPAASVGNAAAGQITVSVGADQILIDGIQVVLRKVRLDGAPNASCPDGADDQSECGVLRMGPIVYDLPLDAGAEPTFTALLPVGTYHRLQVQIHKPSDANGDAALVAERPEMANTSIRVTGTYNGTGFVYATDLTEVENIVLTEPVEVAAEQEVPLTLQMDASGWFVDAAGTGLVNPALANDGEPLESLVERNIRASFRAFPDADADGIPD